MVNDVVVTEAAANKVWSLMVEEENLELCLRAFISGGGCSGFQYNFTFEEQGPMDDDRTLKTPVTTADGEVTLLLDPMSYPYLKGATIDYQEDIHGAQFVIRANPNAKTTCGCGSSFSG